MQIAVVQHGFRASAEGDALVLVESVRRAALDGAELVFLPDVPSLFGDENLAREVLFAGLSEIECARLVPSVDPVRLGFSSVIYPPREVETLGRIALMVGDACLEHDVHVAMLRALPNAVLLCPRSESELQAEAMLELAIHLSLSLAGLVMIAECSGADPGDAGHGGSAIVLMGDVVAEAMQGDDVLVADITLPIPQPEPAEELPGLPPILEQRLAHHRGQKVPVNYPADLSS